MLPAAAMRALRPACLAWTAAAAILGGPVGCRSIGNAEIEAASRPGNAACPVCRCEGDLACVDVRIKSDTPRCSCGGKTFYFCSDECRQRFEKQPAKYVQE